MLNTAAATLTSGLARLANPPLHPAFRQAVLRLFECMQPVDTAALLARLLDTNTKEVDWVGAVCKKLPALAVMEAFGFSPEDTDFVLNNIEYLTKVMLPNKSALQVSEVNAVSAELLPRVRRHLLNTAALRANIDSDETLAAYVANLIGLLIQSYDAGRGILSNALLQAVTQRERNHTEALVLETLRFDPPIHNTRRILVEAWKLANRSCGAVT